MWTALRLDRDPVASVDRPLDRRIPGVHTIAYNILINGVRSNVNDATADHDRKLYRLLQRYRKKRIHINADKLKFKQSKVAYFGQLLTNDGFQRNPKELTAILNMQNPTDVHRVQCIQGLVNYLSRFLSNLTDLCEPFRQLTHQDAA